MLTKNEIKAAIIKEWRFMRKHQWCDCGICDMLYLHEHGRLSALYDLLGEPDRYGYKRLGGMWSAYEDSHMEKVCA